MYFNAFRRSLFIRSFVFRHLGVSVFQKSVTEGNKLGINSVNYINKFLFIRNYLCSLF